MEYDISEKLIIAVLAVAPMAHLIYAAIRGEMFGHDD